MIALLNSSISWSQNNVAAYSSTGEVKKSVANDDSVMIAYNDLRYANSKMIELKYVKEENAVLNSIIETDSTQIKYLKTSIENCTKEYNKVKAQRNIVGGFGIAAIIGMIVAIFVK